MGSMSWVHWLIVIGVFLLLFGGRGKISDLMGDFAQGIKSFKKGMADDDAAEAEPPKDPKTIDHQAGVKTAGHAEPERRAGGA